jgi:hypothetical protein
VTRLVGLSLSLSGPCVSSHFSPSLSLTAMWGQAVSPSRLLPPIPSPAPATRASPARFQPCTTTPASAQAHPASFPRRAAQGTGWSSLHPLMRYFRMSPACTAAAAMMLRPTMYRQTGENIFSCHVPYLAPPHCVVGLLRHPPCGRRCRTSQPHCHKQPCQGKALASCPLRVPFT